MKRAAGVTLIELVVTILLLGILAALAAVYIAPAINAYFAAQRRAEMADVADTALRRMTSEVRLALPNSARVDPTHRFLEILLTRNGGRYRAANDDNPVTTEDPLDFTGDTLFDTLGPLPAGTFQQVLPGHFVVIHNLGIAGADAYDTAAADPNIRAIQAIGPGPLANEVRITLAANTRFPLESPGKRFFVVEGPVTYACAGNRLLRWSGYAIQLAQPTALPGGAAEAVLADNVSTCRLDFVALPLVARGLVAVSLTLSRAGEDVTLYYEAHVNNVP
ncbi:MAG TPA: prepilin-type N-terminal cleavage/methylation domain-containing protein [Burkholderiales bacterium]|nr:prepilin-type N-terminal cleavage/methylation domain-containing protein [Burkholderiales bacterium]